MVEAGGPSGPLSPGLLHLCGLSRFLWGLAVQPVAYGGRDAVSCLRLGGEGLWLLSWAFSCTDAQVTCSGRSSQGGALPCSVPYQKMQDKSDKLVSSDFFTGEVLLPRLLARVMSLLYDKMFENII